MEVSSAGRVRRAAFSVWATVLSLTFGITFVGLTAYTIGLWIVNQNHATTPVGDLGFFALGGIIIGLGFAAQLRGPERHVAGMQQALIGLFALAVAGLLGSREEPLWGGLLFLAMGLAFVALHPARREIFRGGERPSGSLAALAILAAVPALVYVTNVLVLARHAGASCFLGRCAYGDRLSEIAATAMATVLVGLLSALGTRGWRLSAWSAAASAVIFGLASIALPNAPGALGQAWGGVATAWGLLFIVVAELEARQTWHLAAPAPPERQTTGTSPASMGGQRGRFSR